MARFVLAGGGTGGHVYPALAIGDVLRARGHEVLYYGDGSRLEARVAPSRGYVFRPIQSIPYPRGGILGKIKFAFALLRAAVATRRLLGEDHIDAVLGVGGYISAPPVLAAWSLGLKTSIHEANVVPGLANQLCAYVVDQILLTFEATQKRLNGRAPREVVGVPVNPSVLEGDRSDAFGRYSLDPNRPIVLFVGGSLGAARLNELAIACAKDPGRVYQILHITGPRYYHEIMHQYGFIPEGVCVKDYEERMGVAYACTDLVVCRAGSSTLAELCAVGKASILIPSPHVTENHQEENARGLEAAGAARVIPEAEFDLQQAVSEISLLVANYPQLIDMGRFAKNQARLDAAERAANRLEAMLQ